MQYLVDSPFANAFCESLAMIEELISYHCWMRCIMMCTFKLGSTLLNVDFTVPADVAMAVVIKLAVAVGIRTRHGQLGQTRPLHNPGAYRDAARCKTRCESDVLSGVVD